MLTFAFGILGLIVGSFLNVVILRHGKKGIGGRSACPSCGALIRWHDNIPLLSWLLLRGKCRACHARISLQYPLVEAATGIAFAIVGPWAARLAVPQATQIPLVAAYLAIASLFIAIFVYDLYHKIIPDPWVFPLVLLAFASQLGSPFFVGSNSWWSLFAGPLTAAPLFALWLYSRGAWMGFGDVKLSLAIGWLLGPLYGFVAILFGFVLGAAISVCILLPLPHLIEFARKFGITRLAPTSPGFTMKSEIPFGPFLIASTFIVWLMLINSIDPLALIGASPHWPVP